MLLGLLGLSTVAEQHEMLTRKVPYSLRLSHQMDVELAVMHTIRQFLACPMLLIGAMRAQFNVLRNSSGLRGVDAEVSRDIIPIDGGESV